MIGDFRIERTRQGPPLRFEKAAALAAWAAEKIAWLSPFNIYSPLASYCV